MSTGNITLESLSNNPEEQIVFLQGCIEELNSKLTQKDEKIKNQTQKIEALHDQLKLAIQRQFGRKTEKSNADQLGFFDEPELPANAKENLEQADEEITIPEHKRKKRGRKGLPKDLPREEIIHDLTEDEKICYCGNHLHKIGEDCSEQLLYIPALLKVLVHIRYKYACRKCEGNVKIAELPKQPIPKSIATAELLSQIVVAKYVHHLPLYRQEKIFKTLKVHLPRNLTCLWVMKIAELCKPIYKIMCEAISNGNYTNADESPLRVLKEKGVSKKSKSYMFVYVGGNRGSPTIAFKCCSTRSGQNAVKFLTGFKGYLQTDAFSGYNAFDNDDIVITVGCWAHARRKYFDIMKITKAPGLAHEAIKQIGELYKIEGQARENKLSNIERYKLRMEQSKPILDKFKIWLDENLAHVPPKSTIGKAIGYSLNNWPKLTRFLDNGVVEIDNNLNENAIRPLAVGRKNWLFSGNEKGAEASAIIYSLTETCRANEIEPINYFNNILKKLPYCKTDADYSALTPQAYQASLKSEIQ